MSSTNRIVKDLEARLPVGWRLIPTSNGSYKIQKQGYPTVFCHPNHSHNIPRFVETMLRKVAVAELKGMTNG